MATVYLVGAGPGDPELMTRKAWRLLGEAQVVLHDALMDVDGMHSAAPDAIWVNEVSVAMGPRSIRPLFVAALLGMRNVAYALCV
ncbi:MAG: SAM-dependent methyltransferase [Betaproteobacteria bacterium]